MLAPFASEALTVEEVINPREANGGWVTDLASILSDRTEAKLNQLIGDFESINGSEIALINICNYFI